jgi:branched-chain amino acid transport system substrate-binding protein
MDSQNHRARGLAIGLSFASIASALLATPMLTAEAAKKKPTKTKTEKTAPPIKVAGAPVVVGWISQNGTGNQEALLAEQFVNVNGGVSGRPLKLVTCSTKGTEASAKSCGNQLINKKVKVVLEGSPDSGWPAAAETFRAANTLVIGRAPLNAVEYSDSNAVYLAPSAASVSAATGVFLASIDHPRAVGVLVSSVPAANVGLPLTLGPLRASGIVPIITLLTKGKADPTVVTAAIAGVTEAATAAGGVGAVIALVSEDQCASVMEAAKAQAFSGRLITTDACSTPAVLDAAGDAAEGWVFVSSQPNSEAQPQLALLSDYSAAATKFKIKRSTDISTALNFASVVDGVSLLTKLEKSVLDMDPGVVGATVKSYLSRAEATSPYAPKPYVYKRSKLFPAVAGFTVYATQRNGGRFTEAPGGPTIDAFLG